MGMQIEMCLLVEKKMIFLYFDCVDCQELIFDKTITKSKIFYDQTDRVPVHVDMMQRDEFFDYSKYQSI